MLELQTANKNKKTKNGGGDGITALYCRLSVDDNGTEGESNSIKNQRDILGRYAKQHGYRNIEYYIDDGYSGTNFNRPDFQRMMSDVDEGKVKTIIVKDMSRLGRDYLKVGYLTEFTFAEKDIHFIAINDNVDSENGSDNELIPFKNVFNEWLARDTSKKIRAVIRNKGESGKPLTNTPPLGYMKDPDDKNKWLIDERCAPTIREIFRLCVNGYNALAIAKILTEKGYDTPKAFYLKQGRNMYRNDTTEPYLWHRSTVYKDCLVWCYDDLQNIFDVKIQDTIATFKNDYGADGIDLGKLNEEFPELNNDVVLEKTYRNPLEILVLAHAIGFGIYNDSLIQTLENNQHWHDFGYEVVQGNSRIGDKMEIVRPKVNSPLIISDKQKPEEIIKINSFDDMIEEIDAAAEDIYYSIHTEKLHPDDIIVITLDDKNSRIQLKLLSDRLRAKGIESFNLTDRSYSKGFIEEGCVTLSTVYRAKGNEAAQVYVMGTQIFEHNSNRRSMRNRIFTAFTRAKGWLKISGVNIKDGKLWKEVEKVFENGFTLKFLQTEPRYVIERDKKNAKNKKKVKQIIDKMKELDLSPEEFKMMLDEYGGSND